MSTYMVDGKKMMNICILEILRKYTDSEHTMDQKDIIKKLETEYGMKVDRKSVKSNLMNLVDFGYNLECTFALKYTFESPLIFSNSSCA